MRVLFLGRRYAHFRNFDSVIRELAARGHAVRLAVEEDSDVGRPLVDAVVAECPNVTTAVAPPRGADDVSWVARRLRHGLEYLRYQHPMFDGTPKLRDRSRERTPHVFVALGDSIRRYGRWARRPLAAFVGRLESTVPFDPAIVAFIKAERPDVLLITPLIGLGSSQIDYLRAARMLGIPTALCVWSWDHLSSKALIRDLPDRVFVWNDTQKHEAMTLHGVPAEHIAVTGAQCFDRWFDRQPSRDRQTFCARLGLPVDRPYLLYVCSAPFAGSQDEAPFVVEWIRQVRNSPHDRLRAMPILVRPHPARMKEWEAVDITPFEQVTVWGGNPVDESSRADYFDSLYHSSAVIGLNTSAFIEAGIVGRPVHTILRPEWYDNQMGTVHFRYLLEAGGGLLKSATEFDEHLAQLDESLAAGHGIILPFVRDFVRPFGLDVPATPRFVDLVQDMAALAVAAPARDRLAPAGRRVLAKLGSLRHSPKIERLAYSERELEVLVRNRGNRQEKARQRAADRRAADAAKRERADARALQVEGHRHAKAERDAEKKRTRVEA